MDPPRTTPHATRSLCYCDVNGSAFSFPSALGPDCMLWCSAGAAARIQRRALHCTAHSGEEEARSWELPNWPCLLPQGQATLVRHAPEHCFGLLLVAAEVSVKRGEECGKGRRRDGPPPWRTGRQAQSRAPNGSRRNSTSSCIANPCTQPPSLWQGARGMGTMQSAHQDVVLPNGPGTNRVQCGSSGEEPPPPPNQQGLSQSCLQ